VNALHAPVHLKRLLRDIVDVPVSNDVAITDVVLNSKRVTPGSLFLAIPGQTHDSRDYIADAELRGASAVCFESGDGKTVTATVPAFPVPALATQAGHIAARFFDQPSRALKGIGATGTNGKTTCTWLTASALEALGSRCGVMGTLGFGFIPNLNAVELTTPDAVAIQRGLRVLVDAGAEAVAMELSSHALDQHRATGVHLAVAVFTNLSRDHLDYHGDMRRYGDAKAKLFDFPGIHTAVINVDDDFGQILASRLDGSLNVIRYGSAGAGADVQAVDVRVEGSGLGLTVVTGASQFEIQTRLYGRINIPNVLAVFATLQALGFVEDEIAEVLSQVTSAPGRMELISIGESGPGVVVDYSHTPDSLHKALESLREHTSGSLWCVFGCGGDRDAGKRPMMGTVAETLADHIVITDDNPRSESAANIAGDILAGMKTRPMIIHDRSEAICYAIEHANNHDLVLVAGKGHESTQEICGEFLPMSDREMVSSVLGTKT